MDTIPTQFSAAQFPSRASSWHPPSATDPQFILMVSRLQFGWQSPSSRRTWHTLASALLDALTPRPFYASRWIATNLDLLHPPDSAAYQRLLSLSIPQLKCVYYLLDHDYDHPDWPNFTWDVLAEAVERELSFEM